MHVHVVFAHPSRRSFGDAVLDSFTRGLAAAGRSDEVADPYAMGFESEMDEAQYPREGAGDPGLPVPADVQPGQAGLDRAQGPVFIYPLWWSDCPAGHTAEYLEATGIAASMRRIMLDDRLRGVGVRDARLEILGGMMPLDDTYRETNLGRAFDPGRGF